MAMKTHRDLDVWKNSVEFVTQIYKITRLFPKEELYGITNQIRRAAVSIPSNIAEGAARNHEKEFIQFLYIALASGSEVETQLIISKNLNYINVNQFNDLLSRLTVIQKMLQGLIRSLNK
jgi:four helix bundle protein